MATGSTARSHVDPSSPLPALQWFYRREADVLQCRLSLTADCSAYQLRVFALPARRGSGSELFDDAISAFQRQGRLEQDLLADGWVLDRFERVGC